MKILCMEKLVINRDLLWCVFVAVGVVFLFIRECSGEDMSKNKRGNDQLQTIKDIQQQSWADLARKKIFFGHQSVGNNIMLGVNEVILDNLQIQLNVVETIDVSNFKNPIFAHYSNLGKNNYPLSKVDDFVKLINDDLGDKTDIVFLKFCFVDLESGTEIENFFKEYTKRIAEIKSRYPGLTVVHFTVPLLRKEQSGLVYTAKKMVKRIFGKEQDNFFSNSHNTVRNNYNNLLVSHYTGKEPVFDIARLESTDPAGSRETFSYDGEEYYALVPEYTDDGGHLNVIGRKYIAEQLLIFLANL